MTAEKSSLMAGNKKRNVLFSIQKWQAIVQPTGSIEDIILIKGSSWKKILGNRMLHGLSGSCLVSDNKLKEI